MGVAQTPMQVRVADEQGHELALGEVGEVLVRGDAVMAGYWRNPQATAAAIRDGWLFTGDVGALDRDGFLTLKDRSKDMIISGGSNIYPREVEEVLLTAAGVSEVAVVGEPDREWGESVVAFVVQTELARKQSPLIWTPIACRRLPVSSVRSAMFSSMSCPRTITARCSRLSCANGYDRLIVREVRALRSRRSWAVHLLSARA